MAHNGFGPVGYKQSDWYQQRQAGKVIIEHEGLEIPRCPLCNKRLKLRNGKFGEFWGCPNFRKGKCRYTMSYYGPR